MASPLQRVQYLFERLVVRGPVYRLLAMAGIIIGIAVTGGLAVWVAGLFDNPGDAIWWAFLRLTDPGYLGDDEGLFKRVVSTTITVLGYVVFMGALIAIMTQWFTATMDRIRAGSTPVSLQNHFVVLGWTNRTAAVVRELAVSEHRVRRFYQRLGKRDELRIVILAEHDADEVRDDLRGVLGAHYSPDRITVRVGSPLDVKDLERVDFLRAAAAILPADAQTAELPTNVDAITIKTLMNILHASEEVGGEERPMIVAEVTDDRKIAIARSAYSGPLETLATDRIIARLIAQNIRHRGLSRVYGEILGHEFGNEIYVRDWRGAATTFSAVASSYRNALPFGIVRTGDGEVHTELRPALEEAVEPGDRIVMLASSFEASEAGSSTALFESVAQDKSESLGESGARRILLLGWNRKVPVLLDEFDAYDEERFEVDIVSMTSVREREREIDRRIGDLDHTVATQHLADFTSEDDLRDFDLASYDNIVLVASDWLDGDDLSDARSLLGHLVVHAALSDIPPENRPAVVLELLSADNEHLVRNREDDVVVSPMIVSHMLTHIALRRELANVFAELFGPHGAEVFLQPLSHYGIDTGSYRFDDIRINVARRRDVALGLEVAGELMLNPDRTQDYVLGPEDRIVALTVY